MQAMKCSSCGKQKANLSARKSKLIPSINLIYCADCIKGRFEPRYIIILYGRLNGFESVVDYVKNHRYVGNPILASEFA